MRSGDGGKPLHSWQRGLIYLAVWLIPTAGLKFLIDDVIGSILLHVAYVMMILPAAAFAAGFAFTRRCGLKPWLPVYMVIVCVILYVFCGFDTISPNFIVVNLIGGFFGFGMGNIFKDEALVMAQEDIDNTRKKKKLAEERSYISLIDTDPKTGERTNLRKKRNRK